MIDTQKRDFLITSLKYKIYNCMPTFSCNIMFGRYIKVYDTNKKREREMYDITKNIIKDYDCYLS